MNKYVKQAKDFLKSCNATMEIMYLGTDVNKDWYDQRERDTYMVNIRTPKGNMQVKFWDSINNTLKNSNLRRINRSRIKPPAYDILSSLQKYDVGDLGDFICEFGYEIKKPDDLTKIENIYNAVVNEYNDVCRCFTEEQIEEMQEIQ